MRGEIRAQIEDFFIGVAEFTDKKVQIRDWTSAKKTMRFLDAHRNEA
jgi:hypothetical protein